jgi:D-alanyl-D-alanine dipeptidase
MKRPFTIFILTAFIYGGCENHQENKTTDTLATLPQKVYPDTISKTVPSNTVKKNQTISFDTTLVNLSELSPDLIYDLKYATEDNFLKEKVYDCDDCFLRFGTIKALILANNLLLQRKGFRLKLFDCYRPLSIQKKMWKIMPDSRYVANPYTSGSQHNRGGAVDLTIVDSNDKELDMGTPFDHFGKESHYDYPTLSEEVKANRALLRSTMETAGFKSITTEWWHFSYGLFPLSDIKPCK